MPSAFAPEPARGADAEPDPPPFDVRAPAAPANPLIFASPHSGRHYPQALIDASSLDALAIRRSEDAYVDALFATAPAHGSPLVTARYARAWVDLNRAPGDLDPGMFVDPPRDLPGGGRGARAAVGLGAIPRVVAEGEEIYRGKLAFADAVERLERVHLPYHEELERRLDEAQARFGVAILIDCHSMPAAARQHFGRATAPEVVLGDRFGAACAPAVIEAAERALATSGYAIARNRPYAGGWCTARYGRPAQGRHALQIELGRDLYLDEATLEPNAGFARLHTAMDAFVAALAATDWRSLGAR